MKRTRYYKMDKYPGFLDELVEQKADFQTQATNYSRKITTENTIRLFNFEGQMDYNQLKLINRVRKDAKNYLSIDANSHLPSDYINFFDLMQRPKFEEVITKVDVKSAYWNYALKRGIITQYTDDDLKKWWDGEEVKDMKKARLKALGSLATTKRIIDYVAGEKIYESERLETQLTKELYMDVCRGVDKLMKECSKEVENCYYYYWDCIFVNQKTSQDVIDFMKYKEYDVTVNDTMLEYVEIGKSGYLVSTTDGKIYMVRKESRHILDELLQIDTANILDDLLKGNAVLLTDRRVIDCLMDYIPVGVGDFKPQMVDFSVQDYKPAMKDFSFV